jgi:VWFA-related protein
MLGGGGARTPVPTLTAGLPLPGGAAGTPTLGGAVPPGTPQAAVPTPEPIDPAAVFVPARPETLGRVTITQVDTHRYPQVSVYVSVISPDERPVINMRREHFLVVHNGRPVRDTAFSDMKTQAEPLSTYLVMDNSGSMLGEPLARAKQAAEVFVDRSQPGDFFGLFTFNNEVKLLRDLTVSPVQFKQQLETVQASGTTALWDAVYKATDRVRRDSGRRALVLLSDGGDTASTEYTSGAALEAARRAGVPIFVVGLQSDDFDANALQDIAGQSSGELWVAPNPEDLPGIYEKLAYRFAAQYKLIFTVDEPADDGARSLEIYTTIADKTISGRREYYVSLE